MYSPAFDPIVFTLYMNPQIVAAFAVVAGFAIIKTIIELIP